MRFRGLGWDVVGHTDGYDWLTIPDEHTEAEADSLVAVYHANCIDAVKEPVEGKPGVFWVWTYHNPPEEDEDE